MEVPQENQSMDNVNMDLADISSNEQLDNTIENLENPEKVAEHVINFIDDIRKNYDNYA